MVLTLRALVTAQTLGTVINLDRIGYKKLGVIGRVDIEKYFPSKYKKRIGKKRYLVGFNCTYNYLPNEVNHFSTGFHIGINALARKENKKYKFWLVSTTD